MQLYFFVMCKNVFKKSLHLNLVGIYNYKYVYVSMSSQYVKYIHTYNKCHTYISVMCTLLHTKTNIKTIQIFMCKTKYLHNVLTLKKHIYKYLK